MHVWPPSQSLTQSADLHSCRFSGHYILHSPFYGDTIKPFADTSSDAPQDFPVYLSYALTSPTEMGEVQEELNIREKGAFIVQLSAFPRPDLCPPALAVL